jgi:hypothetical protein
LLWYVSPPHPPPSAPFPFFSLVRWLQLLGNRVWLILMYVVVVI